MDRDNTVPLQRFNFLFYTFGFGCLFSLFFQIFGVLFGWTILGIPIARKMLNIADMCRHPSSLSLEPVVTTVTFVEKCYRWVYAPIGFTMSIFITTLAYGFTMTIVGIRFGESYHKISLYVANPFGYKLEYKPAYSEGASGAETESEHLNRTEQQSIVNDTDTTESSTVTSHVIVPQREIPLAIKINE